MKKIGVRLFLAVTGLLVLLSSCATPQYDRNLLQPDGYTLLPKLPKLEILSAETLSIGSSNQVESSSILYTIFRRELETNICERTGSNAGFIKIDLIYYDVQQNPGISSKNIATLEFEVSIYDKDKNSIWTNVYSGELNDSSPYLAWTFYTSSALANNATSKLAHKLIEDFKMDLKNDYELIVQFL